MKYNGDLIIEKTNESNSIISILNEEITKDTLTSDMLIRVKKHIEKMLISDF